MHIEEEQGKIGILFKMSKMGVFFLSFNRTTNERKLGERKMTMMLTGDVGCVAEADENNRIFCMNIIVINIAKLTICLTGMVMK